MCESDTHKITVLSHVILSHVTYKLITIMVMHTEINLLGLYSFDLKDTLRMAHRCRNMQEIHISYICHKLYFIKCVCCLMY